jgi:hypothetical protein
LPYLAGINFNCNLLCISLSNLEISWHRGTLFCGTTTVDPLII